MSKKKGVSEGIIESHFFAFYICGKPNSKLATLQQKPYNNFAVILTKI